MLWPPVTLIRVALPLNTPPVTVPLFVTLPAKVPFFMVLLFITLHMFLKVPFSMVALAPSFVTLHTSLKVPFFMVPLFVTLHVSWKMPPEIIPPALFVTFPLKVPPVISAPDSITIAHATAESADVVLVVSWGLAKLKSYVPLVRVSVPLLYSQPLPLQGVVPPLESFG